MRQTTILCPLADITPSLLKKYKEGYKKISDFLQDQTKKENDSQHHKHYNTTTRLADQIWIYFTMIN